MVALRRIEGQVRGVQRMVEDRKYCIDILNQINAVKGALARVEERILKKHFQHCVTEAVQGTSEKEKQEKLAFGAGDAAAFKTAAESLAQLNTQAVESLGVDTFRLRVDRRNTQLKPFKWSFLAYLFAAIAYLVVLVFKI